MKISCPSCEAKYSIGDEKVQNRLAKIRCRKCGADIVIDGRVEPPSVTLGGAESAGVPTATGGFAAVPQPEFTVDFAENDQRTLSLSDIVAAYNSGQVTADTFVWAEGMSDWTALGQVPSIVSALNEAASQQPQASIPRATATSRQAQATAASAARATTKGAGRDLFGRVAHAGSEEDVAAAQGGYDPHPAPLTTGARNESSVLFSLSALTATTKSKSAASVPTASASVSSALDDSGLIDLKALASQASTAEPTASAPLAAAPLGMAPLGGLGAPLGGSPFGGGPSPLSAADLAMPPPKSKTGLFIGGGIALAALIVVIAMALRPEPPPPPPAEPLPLPKPTHTAEPAPQPSSEAKPPPTGTEEAPKKVAAPKYTGGGRKKPRSDGSGTTGSGSEGSSSGASTPKPASGGGHCGCSPTDLPCNMKCSAKGG